MLPVLPPSEWLALIRLITLIRKPLQKLVEKLIGFVVQLIGSILSK